MAEKWVVYYKDPGDDISDGTVYGPFKNFAEADAYAGKLKSVNDGDACVESLTEPAPIPERS
jgi:hypothetical protein